MATTRTVQAHTSLGDIASGDKLLGERVAGQTRLVTYTPGTMSEAIANNITVTATDATLGSYSFRISTSYVGQASITTLGTVTTGTWNASLVAMQYGGSGANLTASNGGIIYSTATTMAVLAGTATANKMLLSGSSTTPSWSTSTIPSSAGATANKVLLSDGTNYVLSTPTFPNTSATSGKIIKSDGINWIASTATFPDTGTLGKVLIGDGTNYIESTPKFPNASATSGKIIKSDGTDWTASTETYAAPGASGNVLTSDGTNWTSAAPAAGTEVTQAEQETATNTTHYVSPAKQQFHPSAAKFWIKFTTVTTTAITVSYNVTSLTDNGTGDTTITIANDFSGADYCTVGGQVLNGISIVYSTATAGTQRLVCINISGAPVDAIQHVVAFGDQ